MTYTLTEEQLKELLENTAKTAAKTAAETAIKQYIAMTQGQEAKPSDEDPGAPVSTRKSIKISEFNEAQYQEALEVMAANRGSKH